VCAINSVPQDDLSWLTPEVGAELARIARLKVASALGERYPHQPKTIGQERMVDGSFVTITEDGRLRGCMGYVGVKLPSIKAVERAPLAAAFEDPRFPPLTRQELSSCVFEVTVLGPLRELSSQMLAQPEAHIILGVHGLLVRAAGLSGLLLPQVALEYGWTVQEFLSQTCVKAGLPEDCWRKPNTKVYLFEGKWFSETLEAKP